MVCMGWLSRIGTEHELHVFWMNHYADDIWSIIVHCRTEMDIQQ